MWLHCWHAALCIGAVGHCRRMLEKSMQLYFGVSESEELLCWKKISLSCCSCPRCVGIKSVIFLLHVCQHGGTWWPFRHLNLYWAKEECFWNTGVQTLHITSCIHTYMCVHICRCCVRSWYKWFWTNIFMLESFMMHTCNGWIHIITLVRMGGLLC